MAGVRRAWTLALAFVVGLPLAFFFVLAPLFTDAPAGLLHAERLGSYALSAAVYLVAAALLGLLRPRDYTLVCSLTGPAVFAATLLVLRDGRGLSLAVAYVGLAVAASGLGVWLAGLRRVTPAA
jgi:hypothetical protein